jgi:hypothetical protein
VIEVCSLQSVEYERTPLIVEREKTLPEKQTSSDRGMLQLLTTEARKPTGGSPGLPSRRH